MAMLPNPVIVIPGTTATYLLDQYPLPPDVIWSVMTRNYERAALHPDDFRYEAFEPAQVRPGQIAEDAYLELIEELRFNLTDYAGKPVPVFWFGHDWRKPLNLLEDELAAFIDEVADRTALMPHYHGKYRRQVSLVGHSMGGLISAGYLSRYGGDGRVDKVVSIGTPFQGSFEAPLKIATGTAELDQGPSRSRERVAARMTPSLYHLIPAIEGTATDENGADIDLFDPSVWQRSVLDTLADYVGRHSARRTNTQERQGRAVELLASFLSTALEQRARCDNLDLANAGLEPKDWLCVVGVDAKTRFELKISTYRGHPIFDLSGGRGNDWHVEGSMAVGERTGDGTVPVRGAVPKFLPYESLVCVRHDDFGYWELKDIAFSRASGFHGLMPTMDMLHRLIVRHLTGKADKYNSTWGCPAPGVPAPEWKPPVSNLEPKAIVKDS